MLIPHRSPLINVITELVRDALQIAVWNFDMEALEHVSHAVMHNDSLAKIVIYDTSGYVLYTADKSELMKNSQFLYRRTVPLEYNGYELGTLEVVITSELIIQELYTRLFYTILLNILQAVAIIIILFHVAKRIISPISHMENVAESIAMGNLDNEILLEGNDEIKALGGALLIMQQRIKRQRSNLDLKIEELEEKNALIQDNNLEIMSLYEEASAGNDELQSMIQRNKKDYQATVFAMANAIEASDEYTRGHCDRVSMYAQAIAERMDYTQQKLETLLYAAALHDIGKIGIPAGILNKPGRLTEEEYAYVKQHPQIGYDILKDVSFLEDVAYIVYEHHERIDGKGYPNGLTGSEIHEAAKILSIADAYDAMTSIRPYRLTPLTTDQAVEELAKNAGTGFDEQILQVFIELLEEGAINS